VKAKPLDWRPLVRGGLIAGAVTLYTALIGMLAAFDEREVVRNSFTLGQLLLVAPAALAGWLNARGQTAGSAPRLLLQGLVPGLLASLPLLALLWLHTLFNFRQVLVNVDRDLVRLLSFGSDSLLAGSIFLLLTMGVAGALGAGILLVPPRLRHALLTALAWTLGAGILGELVRQLLSQFLERDALSWFLRRDTLKPEPAAALFLIVFVSDLFWSWYRAQGRRRAGERSGALRYGRAGALAILLLLLPALVGSAISDVLTHIGLYILMGLGLNVAVGLAGLFELGSVPNYAVCP